MSVTSVTCARHAGCTFRDECAGIRCRYTTTPDLYLETPAKEPPVIAGETILEEAARLTTEDRNHTYGPFTAESQKIARVWSAILGFDVPPEKVALCMIGMKIVRLSNNTKHRDGWVDVCGFASIGHNAAQSKEA